jgi:SAM-dependent methyltransferase
MDHRAAVGGMWDVIGALQFDYLVAQGLRPDHHLLDIGCGSLRGGGRFIWYLDVGHYFGIEKEGELLDMGISREILTLRDRQPVFRVCEHFDFAGLSPKPFDFALAQSVFTHLPADEIELCLRNLRPVMADDGVFYATFWLGESRPLRKPRDHRSRYQYPMDRILAFGGAAWMVEYIGEWGHPRGQMMVRFRPA